MADTTSFLLLLTFLVAIAGLLVLIWALTRQQLHTSSKAARVIFPPGDNVVEDAAAVDVAGLAAAVGQSPPDAQRQAELEVLRATDQSSRTPVLLFASSAIAWLLLGSVLGLIVSLKFNWPDWLVGSPLLTFGRLRPMHLNAVAYGWLSMAGVAVALWLLPRLLRTPLRGAWLATVGGVLWNLGTGLGLLAVWLGDTDGLEWLEFPWYADILLVVAGGLVATPLFLTLRHKQVDHLYVSVWYIGAALIWFPILFLVGNLFAWFSGGVPQATANWWFAHNVLGLWFTPIALGSAYYIIPKVLGRPIHSYALSLLGFWALALFYSHVGVHHLIGGPVPTWLVTVSIVTSMMMLVPVVAVAINQHLTVLGALKALKYSPSLRFVVIGAMVYTLVSVQGSLTSLRTVNTVTHFTHYTIAHAHLGAYGFASFIFFGAFYFLLPRLVRFEWPYPKLISAHFWTVVVGFTIYFVFLSIGGVLQGLALQDGGVSFMKSVDVTLPHLLARSIGGTIMTIGHVIFAVHAFLLLRRRGPARQQAPWAATSP